MPFKIFAGIVAVALMIAYLAPVVLKLKDISLGVVILIGLGDDAGRPLAVAAVEGRLTADGACGQGER